jgi:cellobiose-specific phosphotransferase system component IIC
MMVRRGKDFEMKRTRWILVLPACLAVSLFCVAYPIYVIRPFRAQGVRELMAALSVLRYRNAVTILSALVAIGAALAYWRRTTRTPSRMAAVSVALAVCVLAALARVNVYEQLMFHPVDRPAFEAAAEAKLDRDDKLIVVKIGGIARGYPIREMGYHHVVNDEVGGTALAATY